MCSESADESEIPVKVSIRKLRFREIPTDLISDEYVLVGRVLEA